MGREIKRVALDFDWPIGHVWPGYMKGICSDTITYATKTEYTDDDDNPCCNACRHFARLAGLPNKSHGCPDSNIHPPAGDGWQLWETVSEGSPVTQVFATADELIDYLCVPGDRLDNRGFDRETAEAWVRGAGWAPSLIVSDGRVMSGIEGVVEAQKDQR